jgi:hypothetical protein
METLLCPLEYSKHSFPTCKDGVLSFNFPGMIRMIPGITMAYRHTDSSITSNNNKSEGHLESCAAMHNLQSIQEFEESEQVRLDLIELYKSMYGEDGEPLYRHMKANSRSPPIPDPKYPDNASRSIAYTSEEVGAGKIGAAVHNNLPRTDQQRRAKFLSLACKVGLYFVLISLRKQELAIWQMVLDMNNAVTFGDYGLWSGLQWNHSEGLKNLIFSLGNFQGNFHTDWGDFILAYTVFILFVKIRRGESFQFPKFYLDIN